MNIPNSVKEDAFDINQPFVTQEQKFKYWEESKAEIKRLRKQAELTLARNVPVVSGEPVAYRHLHEDGWEYYDAPTGSDCFFCEALFTTPQQTQSVADALEQAVNICDKYLDDLYSLQLDSVKDEILSLIKLNAPKEGE